MHSYSTGSRLICLMLQRRTYTKRRHSDFEEYWLTSRVALVVIVFPAREDALLVQRETVDGATSASALFAHPVEEYGRMPERVVPSMCFDNDLHVRVMRSQNIVGQFFDLQPFQGRNIARDVQLLVSGRLFCEMKVTVLETVDKVEEALLKPDADTAEKPFAMESGDPQPVAIYQGGRLHSPSAAIPPMVAPWPFR